MQPRLIQTYLPSGSPEGVKIIEISGSSVKTFVVPRLELGSVRSRPELAQPAIYFLINNETDRVYIGESENFIHRALNHTQKKSWWDVVVAIVSNSNSLEKSDVKYLESLAVEKSRDGSMDVNNKTIPIRNNIHEFKLHILEQVLDDSRFILGLLGYDVFPQLNKREKVWFCHSKGRTAKCVFRGDQFIVLAKSEIDKSIAPSWANGWPKSAQERQNIFNKYGEDRGDHVVLQENVAFKSPNHAGGFITGRNINAWNIFVDEEGKTMDETMRKKNES